jgi:Zn-dependent protease
MTAGEMPARPPSCPRCGTQLAPTLLACPSCGRLVHAERLAALAANAEAADRRGDVDAALPLWREALELLPAGSRQREVVAQRVNALSEAVRTRPGGPPPPPPPPGPAKAHSHSQSGLKGAGVAVGGIALLLWKFKFVVVFLLTKGKLLLLGLTKSSTLLSMLLSIGVYWTIWGWKFALGLVLSIYIHEMGHVITLKRYGFKATAPTFIPGIGALIRLKQRPANPREDAAIGLAGPIYGLAAAGTAYGLWHATGNGIFAAIAHVGAWINLFNLLPLGPLDGVRAFNALSRTQRWLAAAAILAAWYLSSESLLALLLVVAVMQAFVPSAPEEGDAGATTWYAGLVLVLSLMCLIPVPVEARP